ncbi:MAG: S1 RNA-binding domain-containing protein [Lachnospiraceae bacterium]|nr:S1 RNA-binding domain-containing protein [Lachnospiraceae bacterium]
MEETKNLTPETVQTPEHIETMDDYKEELEASFRKISTGDVLTGTVVSVDEEQALIDLNYYTMGRILQADASDDPTWLLKEHLEVGQEVSATVVRRDDGAGYILLSMKAAAQQMAWDRILELKRTKDNIRVKVTEATKAGVVAHLEGVRGFIPASKLALTYVEEGDLASYVGKTIEVRVIDAEEEGQRLIMSARDILFEQAREERAERINKMQVGMVLEGTVESLQQYGAFIDLGDGLSGLLHVSQISSRRIKHPKAVLELGQKVTVKVTAVKDGKLSLSMKALEEELTPVEDVEEETFELPQSEEMSTSLGSLLAGLKF